MAELRGPGEPDGAPTSARVEHWVEESGTTVISLVGELDVSNAPTVRTAMEPALRRGSPRLVFDLAGLRFMDSSGIALILEVAHRATSVSLRNPTPVIRRVVETTGLADVLSFER